MKKINYRIIELPNYQFLLKKNYNPNNKKVSELMIDFFINEVNFTITLGFPTESKRDEMFNKFTNDDAETLIFNTKESIV